MSNNELKILTPNLEGLTLIGMVRVGQRWVSVAPIAMAEVEKSVCSETGFGVRLTWTTGQTVTLSAEEWADFEKWLKDLHYQMARQAGAQQGLIRTH